MPCKQVKESLGLVVECSDNCRTDEWDGIDSAFAVIINEEELMVCCNVENEACEVAKGLKC